MPAHLDLLEVPVRLNEHLKHAWLSVLLGLCFWCPAVAALDAAPAANPIAVIALVDDVDSQVVLQLAAAVQLVLTETGELPVLPPEQTCAALSGGTPARTGKSDLERLEGIFRQGYLQSYSFEYRRALQTLDKVLVGLRGLRSGQARWTLWAKTKVFQGICHAGLGDEDEALRAFATVLRTRPTMNLARRDYSPRTIALWNKARSRLRALPLGRLAVESDPGGADVFLDGQLVGQTPLIALYPHGRYHLQLRHAQAGDAVRWVDLGSESARIRLQLFFEGALVLDQAQPAIRLDAGAEDLPIHWWSWLGVRLGVRRLVTIQRRRIGAGQVRYIAALVDLERGRKLREGWLTPEAGSLPDPLALDRDARDLARFVSTGHASERLDVAGPFPEPVLSPTDQADDPGAFSPILPVLYAPRPWYKTWWTYAIASAASLGAGAGATLAWEHYDRQAGQATNASARTSLAARSDSWRAASITAFSLSGAILVAGVIVHLTHAPEEVDSLGEGRDGASLLIRF